MSDLDSRIRGVLNWYFNVANPDIGLRLSESNQAIERIKQVFKDAGWHEPTPFEFKLVYRPSPKLNPEWMVRNNIKYDSITDVTVLPSREEYEAAKKAAGIDD